MLSESGVVWPYFVFCGEGEVAEKLNVAVIEHFSGFESNPKQIVY